MKLFVSHFLFCLCIYSKNLNFYIFIHNYLDLSNKLFTLDYQYIKMRLKSEIFQVNRSSHDPHTGCLLVSEPCLNEVYFQRSVILLVDHDPLIGSMGLVLNKSSNLMLNTVIEGLEHVPEIPIFCGGPMESDHLFYVHTLGRLIPGSVQIAEGLYIGGDIDMILSYIKSGKRIDGHIKFFLGYSGWEAGQLGDEISNIFWIVSEKVTPSFCICGDGEQCWRKAVADLGEDYKSWLNYPHFPILN